MRILMVIGQFHPTIGGAERQCEILARALLARGHDVRVLTVRPERGIAVREVMDGVFVERVAYPIMRIGSVRIGFGFLAPLLLAWRAWRILPRYNVVVAHQALWPALTACIAATLRGRPVIVKLGNSGERFDLDVVRRTHWYGAFARWFLLRHVARFIATSHAVLNDLHRAGVLAERMVDIPNGVVLPAALSDRRGVQTALRVVFVGSLTPKKNVAVLLDALSRCAETARGNITLSILGDGPERMALEQRAVALGIRDCVTFCGMVADPAPVLAVSDVFVLPSRTEGLSNAALEAMAHGLPLLLSDAGGNRDLVPGARRTGSAPFAVGTTGILVDPRSPAGIVAGFQWLSEHAEDRRCMGQRARVLAEHRYAMDRVTVAYETLLEQVTRPRVVHLLTFLDSRGGMERQALQLASAYRTLGGQGLFITSAHVDRMWRERLPIAGTLDGFRVYRIPFVSGWQRCNAALYAIGGVLVLIALQRRYDVIHAHQLHTSGIVASVARRFLRSKRVIVKNACGGLYGDVVELGRLAGGRAAALLRHSISTFVGVSTETVAEMEATALHPIVAIPNSVRTNTFVPPTPAMRERARQAILGRHAVDATVVLSVGRLHAQKNLRILINALTMLDDSFILFLVGDGPERVALERHRVQRGLGGRVRFTGAVGDVLPYYHAADVFVLASRSEGMPNVVLEAMACELPIVGSDIPPVRAIVQEGREGILVSPDDAAGFAEAIRCTVSDQPRARQMGRHARDRVESEFSVDAAAQRYATLYASLNPR